MEQVKYWIDADNYLICDKGFSHEQETVANLKQHHTEPLSKILNSQPDLLAACKTAQRCFGKEEPDIMVVTLKDRQQINQAITQAT